MRINRSADNDGWIGVVEDDDGEESRTFYADTGGAWALTADGTIAMQEIGRLDFCATAHPVTARRRIRALYT